MPGIPRVPGRLTHPLHSTVFLASPDYPPPSNDTNTGANGGSHGPNNDGSNGRGEGGHGGDGGGAGFSVVGMTAERARALLEDGIDRGVALAVAKIRNEEGTGALVPAGGQPTAIVTQAEHAATALGNRQRVESLAATLEQAARAPAPRVRGGVGRGSRRRTPG